MIILIRFFLISLLSLSGPYPTQTPYPTHTPYPVTPTVPPTQTPYPTYTPYPSATRPPTNTSLPTITRKPTRTPPTITRPPQGRIMTMTPVAESANQKSQISNRKSISMAGMLGKGAGICLGPLLLSAGFLGWRTGWIQKRMAMHAAGRTQAEKERRKMQRDHDRQEKRRKKMLVGIARGIARQTADVLTGVGYCHQYRNPGQRKKQVQTIMFSHAVVIGEEQVLLRVGRIPFLKSRWDLFANNPGGAAKPVSNGTAVVSWYAAELYLALERQVQVAFFEDVGIVFQVALKQGVAGVPKLVLWRDPEGKSFSMMDGDPWNEGKGSMPDEKHYPRTRLHIPIGMSRNRAILRQDMVNLPHLIVSGATGTGKSNFLNQMICTWLTRNTPQTLHLYLIDLKIMEFAPYLALSTEDQAHMESMVVNVVQHEQEAVDELDTLYQEIERRQHTMAGVCIDIDGWNEISQDDPAMKPMPRIVVIFDELSIVMLSNNRKLASTGKRFLSKCLALGRASGVHMVLCTQTVSRQVVDLLITANTPGKMIFRQSTRTASINALGDGRAWTHLEQPGMGYFCDERGNEHIVQSPLIFEHQRDAVIETELARMEGRSGEEKPITIEDVARYAIENYGGKMRLRDMWSKFRGRISYNNLVKLMKSYYEINLTLYPNGREYAILPGAGNRPNMITCTSIAVICDLGLWPEEIPTESDFDFIEEPENGREPEPEIIIDDRTDDEIDKMEWEEYQEMIRMTL